MTGPRGRCLAPDELVDALDGTLPPDRLAHVRACAACRAAVADLAATLDEVRSAEVPEPPPVFWATINRRVARAVDEERAARAGRWAWLRWDTLVPLAGMAALLVALGSAIAPPAGDVHAPAAPSPPPMRRTDTGEPADAADDALGLVVDLAGTLPDDSADADVLGLAPLPDFGQAAAAALSAAEQQALETLLRDAVDGPTS